MVVRRPLRFALGLMAVALSAAGVEAMPSFLRASPELDTIRTAGQAVRALHAGKGWNFVFGQASLQDRVGVWSLHRQVDPHAEYTQSVKGPRKAGRRAHHI